MVQQLSDKWWRICYNKSVKITRRYDVFVFVCSIAQVACKYRIAQRVEAKIKFTHKLKSQVGQSERTNTMESIPYERVHAEKARLLTYLTSLTGIGNSVAIYLLVIKIKQRKCLSKIVGKWKAFDLFTLSFDTNLMWWPIPIVAKLRCERSNRAQSLLFSPVVVFDVHLHGRLSRIH